MEESLANLQRETLERREECRDESKSTGIKPPYNQSILTDIDPDPGSIVGPSQQERSSFDISRYVANPQDPHASSLDDGNGDAHHEMYIYNESKCRERFTTEKQRVLDNFTKLPWHPLPIEVSSSKFLTERKLQRTSTTSSRP
jgi:hypothetical protein